MSPMLTEQSDRKYAGRIDPNECCEIVEENFATAYELGHVKCFKYCYSSLTCMGELISTSMEKLLKRIFPYLTSRDCSLCNLFISYYLKQSVTCNSKLIFKIRDYRFYCQYHNKSNKDPKIVLHKNGCVSPKDHTKENTAPFQKPDIQDGPFFCSIEFHKNLRMLISF